jgi:hypothetical protein
MDNNLGITLQQSKIAKFTLSLSALLIIVAVFKSDNETADTILEMASYALSLIGMYFLMNYFKAQEGKLITTYINAYITVSIGIIVFTIADLLNKDTLFENILFLIIYGILFIALVIVSILLSIKLINFRNDPNDVLRKYGIAVLITLSLSVILAIMEEGMGITIPSFIYIIDILPTVVLMGFYAQIEKEYKKQTL